MIARWRSWPKWKWAAPLVLLGLYALGPQPTIDFEDARIAAKFKEVPTKRIALYLVNAHWRLFDVDFGRGQWQGFGTGAYPPLPSWFGADFEWPH